MGSLIYSWSVLINHVKWYVRTYIHIYKHGTHIQLLFHCPLLQDVCPLIYNPKQDPIACDPEGIGISHLHTNHRKYGNNIMQRVGVQWKLMQSFKYCGHQLHLTLIN